MGLSWPFWGLLKIAQAKAHSSAGERPSPLSLRRAHMGERNSGAWSRSMDLWVKLTRQRPAKREYKLGQGDGSDRAGTGLEIKDIVFARLVSRDRSQNTQGTDFPNENTTF